MTTTCSFAPTYTFTPTPNSFDKYTYETFNNHTGAKIVPIESSKDLGPFAKKLLANYQNNNSLNNNHFYNYSSEILTAVLMDQGRGKHDRTHFQKSVIELFNHELNRYSKSIEENLHIQDHMNVFIPEICVSNLSLAFKQSNESSSPAKSGQVNTSGSKSTQLMRTAGIVAIMSLVVNTIFNRN